MKDNYDDIIDLPHYEPKNHPRMSAYNRAGQFAPFAALTGYDDEVLETARLTDSRIFIDENLSEKINSKLVIIENNIKSLPEVSITYFVPDNKKVGGRYVTITKKVKRINEVSQSIKFVDNTVISINDIVDIYGDIFDDNNVM